MLEAVFISDLHLHPDEGLINQRFHLFIDWVAGRSKNLYILGDFFHVWAGDDGLDAWSEGIASKLLWLSQQNTRIYFMHGNRDFLLGAQFAKKAGMQLIKEPYILNLNNQSILLAHGDRYCLLDKAHQRFRKLTRNWVFPYLFLKIPFHYRNQLVNKVRQQSQTKHYDFTPDMDVVPDAFLQHLQHYQAEILIHGHTHRPGVKDYVKDNKKFQKIVLSDWDDMPQILCYDNAKGFYFTQPFTM